MRIAVQLEPPAAPPAPVEYTWDPDTEILSAQLRKRDGGSGMSGSVGLEGSDGSWLILDPAERTFHLRLGKPGEGRTVRLANDILLDVDLHNRIAGVWLLNVPPCPQPS